MLSSRYHLGSLVAVFLALGIGMFIGGLIGERFYSGTENRVLQMMMEKYEQRTIQNEQLQQELAYFKRFSEESFSALSNKSFVYISRFGEEDELERGLRMLGAELVKVPYEQVTEGSDPESGLGELLHSADLILTKEKRTAQLIRRRTLSLAGQGRLPSLTMQFKSQLDNLPAVIDVSNANGSFDDPAQMADLVEYMQQVLEGLAHETSGIYYYTRVE